LELRERKYQKERKLHNEEICSLYSSYNTVRKIKWRRIRLGYVARIEG